MKIRYHAAFTVDHAEEAPASRFLEDFKRCEGLEAEMHMMTRKVNLQLNKGDREGAARSLDAYNELYREFDTIRVRLPE